MYIHEMVENCESVYPGLLLPVYKVALQSSYFFQ